MFAVFPLGLLRQSSRARPMRAFYPGRGHVPALPYFYAPIPHHYIEPARLSCLPAITEAYSHFFLRGGNDLPASSCTPAPYLY